MGNKWKHMPRDVKAAMKWADNHPDRDPANGTSWSNHCLASSRQQFGMPWVANSAKSLADRMQKHGRFLHRCKDPNDQGWWDNAVVRGAWLLSDFGSYGHSWVASKTTSWSTDYKTNGKLLHAPRDLPRWPSIRNATQFWVCGLELNGVDYYIKGIECEYPKHEGKH